MRSLFHITWYETKDAMFPSSKWTVISNFWFSLDEEGPGRREKGGERQIYLLYSGVSFFNFFLFCFLKICHLSTTLSCLNCNRKLLPRADLLCESFVRSNPSSFFFQNFLRHFENLETGQVGDGFIFLKFSTEKLIIADSSS